MAWVLLETNLLSSLLNDNMQVLSFWPTVFGSLWWTLQVLLNSLQKAHSVRSSQDGCERQTKSLANIKVKVINSANVLFGFSPARLSNRGPLSGMEIEQIILRQWAKLLSRFLMDLEFERHQSRSTDESSTLAGLRLAHRIIWHSAGVLGIVSA